jgi:hypothetical protein
MQIYAGAKACGGKKRKEGVVSMHGFNAQPIVLIMMNLQTTLILLL